MTLLREANRLDEGLIDCGDSSELPRSRGETKRESLELVGLAVVKKSEILPGSGLDRHMAPWWRAFRIAFLQFLLHYTEIENLQVDNWLKTASPFW